MRKELSVVLLFHLNFVHPFGFFRHIVIEGFWFFCFSYVVATALSVEFICAIWQVIDLIMTRSEEATLLRHAKQKVKDQKVAYGVSHVSRLLENPEAIEAVLIAAFVPMGRSDTRIKKERLVTG